MYVDDDDDGSMAAGRRIGSCQGFPHLRFAGCDDDDVDGDQKNRWFQGDDVAPRLLGTLADLAPIGRGWRCHGHHFQDH